MELNENPLAFEHITDTINMEDIIVVGTDFFLMPKYSGISDIKAAVTALVLIKTIVFDKVSLVSSSGIKLAKLLIAIKVPSIKILDKNIAIKVNMSTMISFATMSFFRFIGYIKSSVIVPFLYSSIISLESSTDANIIKVAFTEESTI
ncbi:hypothetical protein SDC9_156978 [bioreactor metagenome]|uniref:Uncharacterized protein n=1 Tax=bioreactor metagenome TaxID=1076179 RepID=A0A645F7R4_9ZZZZ